jgi:hypothetical protein
VRRLLSLALLCTLGAAACGGGEEPESAPATSAPATTATSPTTAPEATTEQAPATTAEEEEAEPEPRAPPGVPGFVAGYRSWTKLNEEPIPPRDPDPHSGTKDVYVSKERRGNGRFPQGTIVVKEAARPGKDFIGLIAIMRKERGADPAHGDWVFVEYAREARGRPFTLLARDAVCWTCHVGALDSDWVFTP